MSSQHWIWTLRHILHTHSTMNLLMITYLRILCLPLLNMILAPGPFPQCPTSELGVQIRGAWVQAVRYRIKHAKMTSWRTLVYLVFSSILLITYALCREHWIDARTNPWREKGSQVLQYGSLRDLSKSQMTSITMPRCSSAPIQGISCKLCRCR